MICISFIRPNAPTPCTRVQKTHAAAYLTAEANTYTHAKSQTRTTKCKTQKQPLTQTQTQAYSHRHYIYTQALHTYRHHTHTGITHTHRHHTHTQTLHTPRHTYLALKIYRHCHRTCRRDNESFPPLKQTSILSPSLIIPN